MPATSLFAAMSASGVGYRLQSALPARTPLARSHSCHRLRQSASPRPLAYQDSPDTGDGIQLPEVHKLLQVHEAASRDSCLRAYEKLADTPPEAGYSQVQAAENGRPSLTNSVGSRLKPRSNLAGGSVRSRPGVDSCGGADCQCKRTKPCTGCSTSTSQQLCRHVPSSCKPNA